MSPRSPSLDELISLNHEIAALARAGIPLELGLRGLSSGSRLTLLSDRLAERLANGLSLPQAVAEEGPAVSPVYTAVLEAGLASGRLPEALDSLAISGRIIQETRRRVIIASIYPMICLVFGYVLFCGFLTIMNPYSETMIDFLPRSGVIDFLRVLYRNSLYFTLVIPSIIVTLVVVTTLLRDSVTRRLWRWCTSFRWIIGSSLNWAQFSELLALQVDHDAPLNQAFVLAADSTDNLRWQREAREVSRELTNGAPLVQALRCAVSMPPLVRWMLATGEKQGTLAATLRQLSETYRRRALRRAALIKVWLPVAMTICFTGVIGLIYGLAFFIPLRMFLLRLMQE